MNIIVFGSTGGSGRAALVELLSRGHRVTAFARRPDALAGLHPDLRVCKGDVLNADDVARALRGQDAVVVTLGIRENPLWVRLWGSSKTPLDVRSRGTQTIIAAMQRARMSKLVVQSTYGVGNTRDRLPLKFRLFFKLLLRPQIEDTELQERIVKGCSLDWVLVQPVSLQDGEPRGESLVSSQGEAATMEVSRTAVARVLADAVERDAFNGHSVAVSARAA